MKIAIVSHGKFERCNVTPQLWHDVMTNGTVLISPNCRKVRLQDPSTEVAATGETLTWPKRSSFQEVRRMRVKTRF